MPCRCCSAVKPGNGFNKDNNPEEMKINLHLIQASTLIKGAYDSPVYDDKAWKEAWIEAFRHHLYGCPEKCD